MSTDHTITGGPCRGCGHVMDMAFSTTTNNAPRPGDLTLCIRCGLLMAFADDLSFRPLDEQELADLDPETAREISRAGEAVRMVNAAKN